MSSGTERENTIDTVNKVYLSPTIPDIANYMVGGLRMFIKLTPNSNPYFNSKLKFADFVDEDNNSVR